jgi:hypothetical protein
VVTAVAVSKLLSGARPVVRVPSFVLNPLGKIGLCSYSIYLLHQPLLDHLTDVIKALVPQEYRSPTVAFSLLMLTWLAIIPFSVLWYKLFELPAITWGKRIIQKGKTRDGESVTPVQGSGFSRPWTSSGVLRVAMLLGFTGVSLLISAKFASLYPEDSNNQAWRLATNPDAKQRDGPLAVKLAEDACQRTRYNNTIMVGTLAAAYAEAGRFDEAIAAAQKACALATNSGDQKLLENNQQLLNLYLKHQPYHQSQ